MSQSKQGNTYTRIVRLKNIDLTTATQIWVVVKTVGLPPFKFGLEHLGVSSDGEGGTYIAYRLSEEQSLSLKIGVVYVDIVWVKNGVRDGIPHWDSFEVTPTLLHQILGGADGDPDPNYAEPDISVLSSEEVAVINAVSPTLKSTSHSGSNTVIVFHDLNGDHTVSIPDGQTGATGATGADGVSITGVTKTSTSGLVDTYTITYSNGNTSTFTVTNGADGAAGAAGADGKDGADGADGYSPTATVSKSGSTATISITDKNGTTTATVSDGQDGTNGTNGADGQDGVSPEISITDITGGHRLTITDAEHPSGQTVDVMDGTNGEDGQDGTDGTNAYVYIRYAASEPTSDSDMKTTPDAWIGIYSGDAATAPTAYTAYTWYKIKGETGASGGVSDVQVNGTSVVTSGVATIPIGGTNQNSRGVVGAWETGGITVVQNGRLAINPATSNQVKNGEDLYRPLVPSSQHAAAFYGLAKAAGDTSQSSSSNAVGTYTESAKSAIKKMLGVGQWEIIKTVTLAEDSASVVINTDTNDQSFKLKELAYIAAFQPSSSTTQNSNCYIRIDPYNYVANAAGIVRTSATNMSGYIKPVVTATSSSECTLAYTSAGGSYWNVKAVTSLDHQYSEYFEIYTTGTAKMGAGTVITLFGIRA